MQQFSDALARVLARADVREQLVAMGLTVTPMTPQQLTARERAYTQAWTRIIRESGFQPQ